MKNNHSKLYVLAYKQILKWVYISWYSFLLPFFFQPALIVRTFILLFLRQSACVFTLTDVQEIDALISGFDIFEMREAGPLILAWAVFLCLISSLPRKEEANELMVCGTFLLCVLHEWILPSMTVFVLIQLPRRLIMLGMFAKLSKLHLWVISLKSFKVSWRNQM